MAGGLFDSLFQGISGMVNKASNEEAYDKYRQFINGIANNWSGLDTGGVSLARDISMGPSAYEAMQVDPAGRNAQLRALAALANEVDAKGLSEADLMTQRQAEGEANRVAQGQQGAAMQRAAARGMGGGNASLMAQLQAGQAGANTAGMQALGSAAASRNRAMQAAQLMGQQSSLLRGQDYQQASDKAKAQDMVNQFNSSMAMQTQAMNLNQKQRDFENRVRKLQGVTAADQEYARSFVPESAASAKQFSDAMNGFGNFTDKAVEAMATSGMGGAGGSGGGGGGGFGDLLKKFGGGSGSGGGSEWV